MLLTRDMPIAFRPAPALPESIEVEAIGLRSHEVDRLVAQGVWVRRLCPLSEPGKWRVDRWCLRFTCDSAHDSIETYRIEAPASDSGRAQQVIRHRCDGVTREYTFDEMGERDGRTIVELYDYDVRGW